MAASTSTSSSDMLSNGKSVDDLHSPLSISNSTDDTTLKIDNDATHCTRPITINVQDLNLTLRKQQAFSKKVIREKRVLHSLHGLIKPGRLLGIMGGSGSGKTTFINILSGRFDAKNAANIVEGAVCYNGRERAAQNDATNVKVLDNLTGYVLQHDHLLPYLTVRETLRYAAKLRLPPTLTREQKYDRVERTIMQLGLKDCADTIIGNEIVRGCSGGERRRVSVAVQMLTDPSILFTDECTTGLDSFNALLLIQTLQNLARQNRTVICTIHQPRSAIFSLFDDILILSRGRCVYWGARDQLDDYFSRLNYTVPADTNPADYYVDISSIDMKNDRTIQATKYRVKTLVAAWNKHSVDLRAQSTAALALDSPTKKMSSAALKDSSQQHATLMQQISILTKRSFIDLFRDRILIIGFLIETIFFAIMTGLIWLDLPNDNVAGIRSRYGGIYLLISLQPYLVMIFAIHNTCNALKTYDVEKADGMYSTKAFVIARTISQLPFHVVFPLIYLLIFYWMVPLRAGAGYFWITYIVLFLCQYQCVSVAYLSAAVSREFAQASLVGNSFYTFVVLSAGYVIIVSDLPVWLGWIRFLSFAYYGFEALLTNEFGDRQFDGVGPQFNGNAIIDSLAFPKGIAVPLIVIAVITVAFQVGAYLMMEFAPVQPSVGDVGITEDNAAADELEADAAKQSVSPRSSDIELSHSHDDTTLNSHVATGSARQRSSKAVVPIDDSFSDDNAHPVVPTSLERASSGRRAITVHVDDLCVTVPGRRGDKPILQHIHATIRPGVLTVLCGSSGSGKTTLLNALAGRLQSNLQYKLTGGVKFNDDALDRQSWRSVCGYVAQADHLLPCLTVTETLDYAAQLRMPPSTTKEQRMQRVQDVITELGLTECANTRIGDELVRGISGGEKRRVSVAIQLLTDPSVLLCDEVTSGLDSFSASHVMHTLKRVASRGRTVICSIHQPASTVYALFDKILLLAKGNLILHCSRQETAEYFDKTLNLPIPALTNPADWILDCSSLDFRSAEAEAATKKRVKLMIATWKDCEAQQGIGVSAGDRSTLLSTDHAAEPASAVTRMTDSVMQWLKLQYNDLYFALLGEDNTGIRLPSEQIRQPARFRVAFPVLLKRICLDYSRNLGLASVRIWQILAFGVILLCFYSRRLQNDQTSVLNRLGITQEFSALLFTGMLNSIAFFPTSRNVFYRESVDGIYSTLAFLSSYSLIEIIMEIIAAFLFTICCVFGIGLRSDVVSYFMYTLLSFCVINAGESLGILFCAIVYQPGISVSITNVILSVFTLTCGIFSLTEPAFIRGIDYISIIHYTTRAQVVREFEGRVFECPAAGCAFPTGDSVIQYSQYGGQNVGTNVGLAVVFAVAYRIIAYLVLANSARKQNYAQ